MTLHRGFLEAGHESTVLVGQKTGYDPNVISMSHSPNRQPRVLGARLAWKLGYQGMIGYPGAQHLERLIGTKWDFMIIHGLHGNFFDFRQLPILSSAAPTAMVLHDMMPFTGHCGHALECERYSIGCGKCPDLQRPPTVWIDRTRRALRFKEDTIGSSSISITAPSKWLLQKASRSYLNRFAKNHIALPIDSRIFLPFEKALARKQLGLPSNAFILLLPSSNVQGHTYKGLDMVRKAMKILNDPNIVLVTFGGVPKASLPQSREIFIPTIKDENEMARYYASADIVVYPSKAESSGLAIIEGMACSRPIIATSVGGIPELVTNGVEGLLVEPGDEGSLAKCIRMLISDPGIANEMGKAGVRKVRQNHALETIIKQWLEWYDELSKSIANNRTGL